MVVLIFRCPIKSFMISIGTPALTKNVAAKWRNDLNEWPWYPALLQALSISVLIAFVLATWKNDWFFSIGQINKERTSFSFWHMGISTQCRVFPWYLRIHPSLRSTSFGQRETISANLNQNKSRSIWCLLNWRDKQTEFSQYCSNYIGYLFIVYVFK